MQFLTVVMKVRREIWRGPSFECKIGASNHVGLLHRLCRLEYYEFFLQTEDFCSVKKPVLCLIKTLSENW